MVKHSKKRRKKGFFRKFLKCVFLFLFFVCMGVIGIKTVSEFYLETGIKEKKQSNASDEAEYVLEVLESDKTENPSDEEEFFLMKEYYYEQLTEMEKQIYRELLDGIQKRETEIYLSVSDSAVISRAFHALGMDHSELFWIHNHETVYQTLYPVSDYCVFEIDYIYSEEEIVEIQDAMEHVWKEVSQQIAENLSGYEKVKAVYTYLIDEIEYTESAHDQNIAGAFWKKECVCAGYTRAAQYLLNRMGIPCIFVSGVSMDNLINHSWNIVLLGDNYYYMDVTNGDQRKFLEGEATELAEHKTTMYDYLCPFPEEYERIFQADSEFEIPACTGKDNNFYVMNLGIFDTYEKSTIYEYCCMRLDYGAAVIRFKFTDQNTFEKAYNEWVAGDAVKEAAQYYMKKYNLQRVEYHVGTLKQFYTIYIMF